MEKTCAEAYSIFLNHYKPEEDENIMVDQVCKILDSYDTFINYQQLLVIYALFKISFEKTTISEENKMKVIKQLTKLKFCNYDEQKLSVKDIVDFII